MSNVSVKFSANVTELLNALKNTVNNLNSTNAAFDKTSKSAVNLSKESDKLSTNLNKVTDKSKQASNALNSLDNAHKKAEDSARKHSAAQNDLSNNLNKASLSASSLKGVIGPLAVLAVAAKIAQFGKEAINAADQLQDLADKSRLTTKEVQELQFVAERSGTSFDALSGAMTKLELAQSQAINGSDEQVKLFKALGVEFKNLDGTARNKVDLFKDVADSLKDVGDESLKTEVSTKLFGRSFSELEGVLKLGKEGIDNVTEEANKYRIMIGKDAVEASGKFNDAIGDLGNNMKASFVNSISTVLSKLGDLITKFNEASKAANGFFGGLSTLSALGNLSEGTTQQKSNELRASNSLQARKTGIGGFTKELLGRVGIGESIDGRLAASNVLNERIAKEQASTILAQRKAKKEQEAKALADEEAKNNKDGKKSNNKTSNLRDALKTDDKDGKTGGSSGGSGGAGRDVVGDQLRQESELYRAQAQLLIDIEKNKNSILLDDLKNRLDQQLISSSQYIRQERDLKTSQIDLEISEAQRQRSIAEQLAQRSVGDVGRQAEAKRRIVDIDRQILNLESNKALAIQKATNAIEEQQRKALQLVDELNQKYASLTNTVDLAAANNAIERSYREQLNVLENIEDQITKNNAINQLNAIKNTQLIQVEFDAKNNMFKNIEQLKIREIELDAQMRAQKLDLSGDEAELFVAKRKQESLKLLNLEALAYIETLKQQRELEKDPAALLLIDQQILKYKELSVRVTDELGKVKTFAQETADVIDSSLKNSFSNFDITKPKESFKALLDDLNGQLLKFFTEKAFEQIKTSFLGEGGSIGKLLTGGGFGGGGQDQVNPLLSGVADSFNAGVQPILSTFGSSLTSVSSSVSTSFGDILSNVGKGFGDIFSNLGNSLSGLFSGGGGGGGFLSSIGSLFTGGGGGGGLLSGIGSFFGGFLASGGQALADTPYVVGENGPELFIPNSTGRVVNTQDSQKMMGGNTININVSAKDADSFRQSASQIYSQAQEALSRSTQRNR